MEDYATFGDAIYSVTSDLKVQQDDWSVSLANDAFAILEARFPELHSYQIVVLHGSEPTAFTADGRHIFLTRSLLELCSTVETVAFIIAHEIAHHELGHIKPIPKLFKGWLKVLGLFLSSIRSPVKAQKTKAKPTCSLFKCALKRVYPAKSAAERFKYWKNS